MEKRHTMLCRLADETSEISIACQRQCGVDVTDATDGKQQGSALVVNGATTIHTSLRPGSIAVVMIGEKAVKVLIK